jgi:sugar-specific transcriptional regulator TrmB
MSQQPEHNPASVDLSRTLSELGFSQYEARCYVGLMSAEPQTGYRVAKVTGVPQPKVYETLRKLVSRGFVVETGSEPTMFSAVPPEVLLRRLEENFEKRIDDARDSVRALASSELPSELEHVERFASYRGVLRGAEQAIALANRRIYLSASADELDGLASALVDAVARDVDVVVLTFGRRDPDLPGARIFRHASTEGALYRHHQARHIALVVDSRYTVNALAADGTTWAGVRTQSEPIIAAVKGFIIHDLDLQQVFADFGPALVEAYGPGLQRLESYRSEPAERTESAPASGRQEDRRAKARRKTG